ncbi:MAG: thiamine biosynthesis lipoprotein [Paraglaciecola sp.]|jgi:thiamine biosynthesis lipoprotein
MSKIVIRNKFILGFIFLLCLASCSSDAPNEYLIQGESMGTTYNVKIVFNHSKSSDELELYRGEIKKALHQVDVLMSTYRADSEVSILNNTPEGQSIPLSAQTYEVLSAAYNISRLTDGSFDMTVGPLVNLWGFGPKYEQDKVPSSEEVLSVKSNVNWRAIKLKDGQVKKSQNVSVDLSAIAKGYAVDQVALSLKYLKVDNFLIEVGGEISVFGLNSRNEPWVLGIEQPNIFGREAYTTISLDNNSLATSGDYRNYFEKDGKRYSHTIDPTTGYPVSHRLASVSVIAGSCMESDALATALMVMGEERGYQFALKEGINAYFIYRENEGFKTKYTPGFKLYLN